MVRSLLISQSGNKNRIRMATCGTGSTLFWQHVIINIIKVNSVSYGLKDVSKKKGLDVPMFRRTLT